MDHASPPPDHDPAPPARALLTRDRVRPARFADAPRIAAMCRALAVDTTGRPGAMSAAAVRRDLIDAPQIGCLVADRGGEAVGYAIHTAAYDSAIGARGFYVPDLFVEPAHRGRGLGTALIRALAARAEAEGGRFLWWSVVPGTSEAGAFYDRLGAAQIAVEARAVIDLSFRRLLEPASGQTRQAAE